MTRIIIEIREVKSLDDLKKLAMPVFKLKKKLPWLAQELVNIAWGSNSPSKATSVCRRSLRLDVRRTGYCRWLAKIKKDYGSKDFRTFVEKNGLKCPED